jgi:ribosome-associated heat shock protein Hsp15
MSSQPRSNSQRSDSPGADSQRSDSRPSPGRTTGSIRVDKWLWAVRVYKTRTAATSACTSGRVKVNDEPAKPATKIVVGDLVEARRGDHRVVYRVTALIEKRVGAKLVADCVEDLSPARPPKSDPILAPPGGARERGTGRPTKKERRTIDRLRGR